ncbi:hypothetical protein ES288_D05G261400v1 [Gossypium darwinii]|uniref:RING-type domain-containing protein n=2 Tax=Gossypium TaxID=3633 RepID=A0A5D2L0D3_GOSTO|nr:hypothetical protein ES288_D05G261400v1 [Gossypium darwinii]TYH72519.1 hypothetical protein ES332_D05G260500v1 [Gossypium tomentosum]
MENGGAKQSPKMLPFTQLDLIDADLAVALALQEQERVFSLLETVERDGYDNDVDDDSDVFHDQNNNTSYEYIEDGGNLEFLNRQDSNDSEDDYDNDDDDDNDDFEEHDIDLDDFSYEELIALGELIGIERRGLSEKEISSCLVPVKFQSIEHENEIDRCVICQVEYGENEGLVALPNCKHPYHLDCISKWLQMKKLCPICSTEISSSIHQC